MYAFTHPLGCSQLGEDHENTRRILAASWRGIPNAGGVLVLGLGCENNTLAGFRQLLGKVDAARYRFLVAQDVEDEMAAGMKLLESLAAAAGQSQRQPAPVSALRVGLKCGGSDGFSGITANPLLGRFSDLLIARGGTTVLTEAPEMFGAETLLMNRCVDREVFDRCVAMINGFKEYYLRYNQAVYENPSPATRKAASPHWRKNRSAACRKAAGHPDRRTAIRPAAAAAGTEPAGRPGNDIISVTALAAAGGSWCCSPPAAARPWAAQCRR